MSKPCDNCPFNETGPGRVLRDSLRGQRFQEIRNHLLVHQGHFICHKTAGRSRASQKVCAGALALQHEHGVSSTLEQIMTRILSIPRTPQEPAMDPRMIALETGLRILAVHLSLVPRQPSDPVVQYDGGVTVTVDGQPTKVYPFGQVALPGAGVDPNANTPNAGTEEEYPSYDTAEWQKGNHFRRGHAPNAVVMSDYIEVKRVGPGGDIVFADFDREMDGNLVEMAFQTNQITKIEE